jgi:hypothetical protein
MKTNSILLGALALIAGAAQAATPDPAVVAILQADKLAVGGPDAQAATADFAFSGMGLTGKVVSITDLKTGRYLDTMAAGPMTETDGFDGVHAWSREPSGTVTTQDGGDGRALAINEAYRRSNAWWRADLGGAAIAALGRKQDAAGVSYDVLSVTPVGGKTFEAWFGVADHLLDRVVEAQGSKSITTTYSDYRDVSGAKLAGKATIDGGDGAKYIQTLTLVSARFEAAPPASTFAVPKTETKDAAIAGGAAQAVMPFTLINNHVYGEATIDGKGPYRFIFDTGGLNLVTPTLAKTLGLATAGQFAGSGAGEGTMEGGFTKVAELKVADATIRDQSFYVLPLDAMSKVEGVEEQGMIGYETFRRFVTRFDYGAHTVTLIDPKRFDPKDAGTPIHFDFADHNPEISGSFEGMPGKFRIDTGARDDLTLNKPFVARNDLRAKHPKGADVVDGWGIGGPSRGYVTRASDFSLGPVVVHNVVASFSTQDKGAFAGDDYQGNIGAGILKRFVVTFDYEHQIVYLKPLPEPVADTGTFDRAGMWFNAASDGFEVVDVTKNGPAEAAGIKAGDHIVAIDAKPAGGIPLYEERRRLRNAAPGTVTRVTIIRDGRKSTVEVTLRDLI